MGRIVKLSKTIVSLNIILAAAVFIASAIYTVDVIAQEDLEARLSSGGFPYSPPGMAESGPVTVLAPGYYYTTTAAFATNVGSQRVFAELQLPKIYLTRDKNGNRLDVPVPAPEGMVTIKIDILTVSAIGEPANERYVNNISDYRMYGHRPGNVYHWVMLSSKKPRVIGRHFFEFDTGWDEPLTNPDGSPMLDGEGNQVTEGRECGVTFRITVDAKTNAGLMTNEWNGAVMEGLGFKAARADSDADKRQTFGLTQDDLDMGMVLSECRSFYIMPVSN
jgi:hypothetical protein